MVASVQNKSNRTQCNTDLSDSETAFAYNLLNETLTISTIGIRTKSTLETLSIAQTTSLIEENRPSFSNVSSTSTLSPVASTDGSSYFIYLVKRRQYFTKYILFNFRMH